MDDPGRQPSMSLYQPPDEQAQLVAMMRRMR
jgi:hypothetical protein